MKKKTIAIIDSGIDDSRVEFSGVSITHVDLGKFESFSRDDIGHGTAVAFLISRKLKDINLISIKIFGENYRTTEDDFIDALKYIDENLEVDLINISSGVITTKRRDEFESVCNKLHQKNIPIVAAFANQGIKSYPACFDSVISVYWSTFCLTPRDFFYVENSPIDVLGYAGRLRLPWLNGTYQSMSGSSFATARISEFIVQHMQAGSFSMRKLKQLLKEGAASVKTFNVPADIQKQFRECVLKIKSAIVLPVNKEVHAIIGNSDLLPFDIAGIYDVKLLNHIGQKVETVAHGSAPIDQVIQPYTEIDWDSNFDTVILGHTVYVDQLLKMKFCEYVLDKCIEYKKNLVAFDPLGDFSDKVDRIRSGGNFVINYQIDSSVVADNTYGSMNKFSFPVLGVYGTSSKQGKFNIQIELRRRFLQEGFSVGQLGTEPSSPLFGFDIVYPSGFNSDAKITAQEETYYLNHEIGKLRNIDILITGAQSNTVAFNLGNVHFSPFSSQNLLFASDPDAVILAVNFTDNFGYISRTINYIESYYGCKVLGLVLFPYLKSFEYSVSGDVIRKLSDDEVAQYKLASQNILGKPVYLNSTEDLGKLFCVVKDFFS